MDNKTDTPVVPYVVFESVVDKYERMQVRLIRLLLISMVMTIVMGVSLFLVNRSWLKAWSEYDYVTEETTVDVDGGSRGIASYIGGDGEVINGTNTSD